MQRISYVKIIVAEKISATAVEQLQEPGWTVLTADQLDGKLEQQLENADALIVRSAVQADAKLLEHAAHGIKGSVANFSAPAAEDAAFQLEQMGRAQKLDQAPQTVAALEQALALLQVELASL